MQFTKHMLSDPWCGRPCLSACHTHHIVESLNTGLLGMEINQGSGTQAVNRVRLRKERAKHTSMFSGQQTRIQGFCDGFSPPVWLVCVEVVGSIEQKSVADMFVASGAFHEGVK